MTGNMEKCHEEVLDRVLETKWMARKFFWTEKTDSTNIWAKEQAKKNGGAELNGALFLAEEQTAGRGRFGRVWTSPAGQNAYMTLLLWKPETALENTSQLTLVMGLSVAQAAGNLTGQKAGIKWPNDVVISGKKICGILTEMQIKDMAPEFVLIGVGVNINQREFPEEISDKATSLSLESGKSLDRMMVIAEIMKCFEKNYELFLKTQNLSLLKQDYEDLLLNKDQQVRILEKECESRGTARGITEQGELLVEDENGMVRKIFSGEVSVRGLYSYV